MSSGPQSPSTVGSIPQARDHSPWGFETKVGRRERLGEGQGAHSPDSWAQWPEPSVTATFITSNTTYALMSVTEALHFP